MFRLQEAGGIHDWIIPPVGKLKENRFIGDDYPHKSDFNRPDLRVLGKSGGRQRREGRQDHQGKVIEGIKSREAEKEPSEEE
ncbi:MAG: hypothetical protein P8L18_10505 [Verrucomicrobiota bacterium]|nr:hypothetical protein [Verrucomicrobiota bacterium]